MMRSGACCPMPDIESKLSPDEYKTYLAYREKRDGFGNIDETSRCRIADAAAKAAGFVDKPLQLAVEYSATAN